MIVSMTGFGSSRFVNKRMELEFTVRSVNSKYLDVKIHCPRQYMVLEKDFERRIEERLGRGTVDVFIRRKLRAVAIDAQVDTEAIESWVLLRDQMSKKLKTELHLSWAEAVSLPYVLGGVEEIDLLPDEPKWALSAFERSLVELCREREREGRRLQSEILRHLKSLDLVLRGLESQSRKAETTLRDLRLEKIKSLLEPLGGGVISSDMAAAVAMTLDKMDTTEERARLKAHLIGFRKMLKEPRPGKKLDFYCQELLREVNTIGSKAQWAGLTEQVVRAKVLVDQLREQVQNIE